MVDEPHDEAQEPASLGERLRQAREASGLELADIATQTRIPIRHLQHIETEDWDALPAPTYAIGFARAYANAVGLDGAVIGRELRHSLGGTQRRVNTPEYFEPADPARVPPRALAIIAVIVAIALVAAYAMWRSSLDTGTGGGTTVPLTPAPQAAAPAAAPQPRSLAGQPVTLTATGEVWLAVTEGPGGASLFQGTLTAGQTFAVPATAQHPMLRTGRPQLLRASAGGRELGLIDTSEHTVSDVSLLAQDLANRSMPPAAAQAPAPTAQNTAPPAQTAAIPLAPGAQPLNQAAGP